MSVTDGMAINATNVNQNLASKSSDNTLTGVQTLNASGSGSQISNVQQTINNQKWSTYTTEDIASSGTISSSTTVLWQYRRVQGDGGAQSISDTPFGTTGGWADGLIIRLVGISDTNKLSLTHNDDAGGCLLNGNLSLSKGQIIDLQYDSVLNRWIEISRNN